MTVWIPVSLYRWLPMFYFFSALVILNSEPVLGGLATFFTGIGLIAYAVLVLWWRVEAQNYVS